MVGAEARGVRTCRGTNRNPPHPGRRERLRRQICNLRRLMIGLTASTAESPRLVRMIVGRGVPRRSLPARARVTTARRSSLTSASCLRRPRHDRRRDEAARAGRRRRDVHLAGLLVTSSRWNPLNPRVLRHASATGPSQQRAANSQSAARPARRHCATRARVRRCDVDRRRQVVCGISRLEARYMASAGWLRRIDAVCLFCATARPSGWAGVAACWYGAGRALTSAT